MSLETLERQQHERFQLEEAIICTTNDDSDGSGVAISFQEPEKYPILNGYQVTGKLQVLSLCIE